jgi:WD40 repeat protein
MDNNLSKSVVTKTDKTKSEVKVDDKLTKSEVKGDDLKIMEWRFNQFLGEKLNLEDLKNNPENESFLVTDVHFSPDGLYSIVSDKGGRLIIFRKNANTKVKNPKLAYHYEYAAHEKEFDRHKSCEYSEGIRAFTILENQNINNIDILSAGFRNIKLDRVYNSRSCVFDTDLAQPTSSNITIPKLKETNYEVRHKTKAEYKAHNNEIRSITNNKLFTNNFISADEYKVYLWDMNSTKEVYNPVDLEINSTEVFILLIMLG